MEKLAVEEENRTLRDTNFEVQSKARAADAQLRKVNNPPFSPYLSRVSRSRMFAPTGPVGSIRQGQAAQNHD